MIESYQHRGKYIDDVGIEGERRADLVAPAHCNGMQVSENRFILFISMLQFRGTDDNTSAIWQLRDNSYDGPIVKEGVLVKSIDDWYPLGDKYRCVRQYGHPVPFGVPKGALINGKKPINENVFGVAWRKCGRVFVPTDEKVGGYLMWTNQPHEVRVKTQCVEWAQFRLTDDENDIEILEGPQQLRQLGYEEGEDVCSHPGPMNQSYVNPVPFNDDATEWVGVNTIRLQEEGASAPLAKNATHVGSQVAALKYRFNPRKGLYEYVETGPLLGPEVFEGNISRYKDDFVISARRATRDPGVAWARVSDPFNEQPELTIPDDVNSSHAPLAAYNAADGVIRLCTGDGKVSPYGSNRDPIYMWDIDVDNGFRASNRIQLYSPREDGNPIPLHHGPLSDMIKLLPHAGGKTQKLIHRTRTCAMAVKHADYPSRIRPLTKGDFEGTAVFHADVNYTEAQPPTWEFA